MQHSHSQPGRRFATGTNRADHLLGLFGFIAHALLFVALGAGLSGGFDLAAYTGALAGLALLIRGGMVGSSTTKESLAAISQAWFRSKT